MDDDGGTLVQKRKEYDNKLIEKDIRYWDTKVQEELEYAKNGWFIPGTSYILSTLAKEQNG